MDIVVGIDGSAVGDQVLDAAIEEARLRKATLHVVHALFVPAPFADGMTFVPGNLIETSYELAEMVKESVWRRVKEKLGGGDLKWVQIDRTGYPPDEIVDYAKSVDAEMIVVGSRGFGGLKSLLLGSTSHRVSHLASCDVLIVKTEAFS